MACGGCREAALFELALAYYRVLHAVLSVGVAGVRWRSLGGL